MPRKEVQIFAEAMENKLIKNDHKHGWKDCTLKFLHNKLNEEVCELMNASHNGGPIEVLNEASDVANIAMMIADILGGLDTIHCLKTLPEYFESIYQGYKTFEVRKNDRDFKVGDLLILKEWNGMTYTNREIRKRVNYILSDPDYVKEGFVIMGLNK